MAKLTAYGLSSLQVTSHHALQKSGDVYNTSTTSLVTRVPGNAGTGSQLIAYSLSRSEHQASITVFDDGTRVHGIDSSRHPGGAVLVVHGGRRAKACGFPHVPRAAACWPSRTPGAAFVTMQVLQLLLDQQDSSLRITVLHDLGTFPQWTMDACITSHRLPGFTGTKRAVIGLSNNSVRAFSCGQTGQGARQLAAELFWAAACTEELLLYSMALHVPERVGQYPATFG